VPYEAEEQSLALLKPEWPDTPLSATGLTESVVQKLNFLARYLPHDYWTPYQIAERFIKGELVRFTSEEQKAKVLQYAAQISSERQAYQKERAELKGRDAPPPPELDWAVKSVVGQEADYKGLVDIMARGVYPELPTGQRPLFAGIHRQLRNNETYVEGDTDKFMGRIEQLISSVQKQAAAQKEAAVKQ
jgi:hypothetical protein